MQTVIPADVGPLPPTVPHLAAAWASWRAMLHHALAHAYPFRSRTRAGEACKWPIHVMPALCGRAAVSGAPQMRRRPGRASAARRWCCWGTRGPPGWGRSWTGRSTRTPTRTHCWCCPLQWQRKLGMSNSGSTFFGCLACTCVCQCFHHAWRTCQRDVYLIGRVLVLVDGRHHKWIRVRDL